MKVQKMKNNQFVITIPQALAKALRIGRGDEFDFKINRYGNLELEKKD